MASAISNAGNLPSFPFRLLFQLEAFADDTAAEAAGLVAGDYYVDSDTNIVTQVGA